MIVVTVQYIDDEAVNIRNGGTAVHFYNLDEAKLFARAESEQYSGAKADTGALCKVYNEGEIIKVWQLGVDITG